MIRTLVVDDDFRIAAIHREYLERIGGFEVLGVAHSATDALAQADRLRPELVLLDLYLPDGSGLDVLRELRAAGRTPVDVIVISAAKDVDTLRQSLQGGVVHYIVKPFPFTAFREKLESYAAARERLGRMPGELDQADIDELFAALRSRASDLPKGLSAATLKLVARTVREIDGECSAGQVAQQTGLSRVTSRRYLDYLTRAGRVELSLRYGATGRPEHRYRWVRPEVAASSGDRPA